MLTHDNYLLSKHFNFYNPMQIRVTVVWPTALPVEAKPHGGSAMDGLAVTLPPMSSGTPKESTYYLLSK